MQRYNPKDIEPKWQRDWANSKLYEAKDFDDKPKFVMLTEFPYPSGDGLHIGHVREYTLADIIARHKRMHGYNVMYPMGYDAFGLPTENYAIKHKIAPQVATDRNVANFQKQFEDLGYSIDWSRSFRTTDPDYYKWTQWLFLQFFKAGLAYQQETAINWCPHCKTGLANEEVVNGRHERCDTLVEKKLLNQWLLAITKYADRLIEGLKDVDYPSRIADQQVNWIGKSTGAEVAFPFKAATFVRPPNFLILHGWRRGSEKDFMPWLKQTLEANGYAVQIPQLPATDNPVESDQVAYVLQKCKIDEHTVVIGHSLGCAVAMKVIEKLKHSVEKLVLIDSVLPKEYLPAEDPERTIDATFNFEYDFAGIRSKAPIIEVISDTNEAARRGKYIAYLANRLQTSVRSVTSETAHFLSEHEPTLLHSILPNTLIFTTRPDTIYGATFMVLAPEHPLIQRITTAEQREHVNTYIKAAQAKTDIERQDTEREKTGVFTGGYAINPATGDPIPVWIADYVLYGYGTGAIMAVPAHDERDFAFATKHGLAIKPVVAQSFGEPKAGVAIRPAVRVIVHDPNTDKYCMIRWNTDPEVHAKTGKEFPGGGVDADEPVLAAAVREFSEETGYTDVTADAVVPVNYAHHYSYPANGETISKLGLKSVVTGTLHSEARQDVQLEGYEKDAFGGIEWLTAQEILNDPEVFPLDRAAFEAALQQTAFSGQGIVCNSGKYDGLTSDEARQAIVADLAAQGYASEKVNYKLRDWIFSRQHYWGEPIPIIHCAKDGAVPVPEDQLPVTLPDVEHYEPTDTGESPLAAIEEWVNTTCPVCGGPAKRETDTMPNWAGSSWYYLRYFDARNDTRFAEQAKLDYWQNVDLYLGGMEHTTLHLLYSRFWHQFLYDQGLVPTPEPYKARRGQGIILAADGSKMSKSKGNVINPSDVINSGYGADALRTAIAFIAPFDQTTPWNPEIVAGTYRFLNRVWVLAQEFQQAEVSPIEKHPTDEPLQRLTARTLKKVGDDIASMNFNTAVSAMMEMVNELYRLKKQDSFASEHWRVTMNTLLIMLAPFAPHMAEELWHQFHNETSIHTYPWPAYDERWLAQDTVELAVQVNGKLRHTITIAQDADQATAEQAAKASPNVQSFLTGTIVKVIYVPGRILNFVVK